MKIVSFFNHKGGVSKTTTTFNLGWVLAERGHRVLMVDADPQCNLTGMALSFTGVDNFADFYQTHPRANLYTAVRPVFAGTPEKLQPADIHPTKLDGLNLLAGHIDLGTLEPELSMANKLQQAMSIFKNLPGAFGYLIRATAEKHGCEIVLVDMSPSIGALNQNLLFHSDYFIVPTSPDYFCRLAIDSLATTLPRWAADMANLRVQLQDVEYGLPKNNPKFIGMLSQRYRPRSGRPAAAFQNWIDQIVNRVATHLVPILKNVDMVVPDKVLQDAIPQSPHVELAQISDFNSLIARSQDNSTAVFALSEHQLEAQGAVLDGQIAARNAFRQVFEDLAARCETIIQNG